MPVTDRPEAVRSGRQVTRGSGVYLASEPDENAPRRIIVDGKRLSRFMDSIYLDRPCEKLDQKKIQVLNEVRRPLLERRPISAVNLRVRTAFARGIGTVQPSRVVEWGCGFHPILELLETTGYIGIDIDPSVISHNRRRHPETDWYEADKELSNIGAATQDAIVSSFVFHFRLSRLHVSTMRRALKPTGILLANVYRRSSHSRRGLAALFEQAGFQVHRKKDAAELCTDHEFWCLLRKDHPDPTVADTVLREVAAGIVDDRKSERPA